MLAALAATAAMNTMALPTDARAGDVGRHHDGESGHSRAMSSTPTKGSGKTAAAPVIPLPMSASKDETNSKDDKSKKGRKHDKSDKRVNAYSFKMIVFSTSLSLELLRFGVRRYLGSS